LHFWEFLVGFWLSLEVPPSNNAQNPTRIFRKCTKSHDWLRIMHKIPRGTSNNAQNLTRNYQNSHNPMRNFQKCRKSHKELPKNPMKNFKNYKR
jgi:hypothetical protein